MRPFCGIYAPGGWNTQDREALQAMAGAFATSPAHDAFLEMDSFGAFSAGGWLSHDQIHFALNGSFFPDLSVTELASFAKNSQDGLSTREGLYAFVLWDAKSRRLVLGRDRLGIKPLFYTVPDAAGRFAFATELQVLRRLPGFSGSLDVQAQTQFFTLAYVVHPRSIYETVRKLSPGHLLVAEGSSFMLSSYWDLPKEAPSLTMDAGARQLDEAIAAAVKTAAPAGPLCAFLSGGLDSSSVVYHLQNATGRRVSTFSARVKGATFDEGPMAKITADHLKTDHHEVWIEPTDVRHLPAILTQVGEPFADPSEIPTFLITEAMAKIAPVALSGDGGDEILGGYEVYTGAQWTRYGRWLPASLRQALLRVLYQRPVSLEQARWDSKLRRFLEGCGLNPFEQHTAWRSFVAPELRQRFFTPEFLARAEVSKHSVFADWERFFHEATIDTDWLRPFQYLDIKTYLVDNNMTKVERLSAAHGLEVRMPFLDRRVVETAFRLPPEARVHGFKRKVLAKQLMRGRLPDAILDGQKRGFAIPLAQWFLGPLASWIESEVAPERLAATGVLRPQIGRELLAEHRAGKVNRSRALWNIVCFVTWWETHVRH